jgi:hypothetical protein
MQTDKNIADGLDLFPVSIIAFGAPAQPVERLMAVQSAVARLVGWLVDLRPPRLRVAPPLQSAEQGDRP